MGTNSPDIFGLLAAIEYVGVARDVPLAGYTTWKVGGPARLMVKAGKRSSVLRVLEVLGDSDLPMVVLGGGSNILFSDSGFNGVVLCLEGELATASSEGDIVVAGGGAPLGLVAMEALRASLTGLEFFSGIPGTVGGALMMNAGAFSCSTADVLGEARTLTAGGEKSHRVFEGGYRGGLVPEGEVVTRATFRLGTDSEKSIRERMNRMRDMRMKTQPLGTSTAGSVFKNPTGAYAGKLIDDCGLKGRRLGGAVVSEKHANFIINRGDATAGDIRGLMGVVAGEVESKFGVRLEHEVRLVGFEEG